MAQQKSGGQGQVKDPKTDGRTKQSGSGSQGQSAKGHGQGQVKDPENDGRLRV
jgi:hypothetical protein